LGNFYTRNIDDCKPFTDGVTKHRTGPNVGLFSMKKDRVDVLRYETGRPMLEDNAKDRPLKMVCGCVF